MHLSDDITIDMIIRNKSYLELDHSIGMAIFDLYLLEKAIWQEENFTSRNHTVSKNTFYLLSNTHHFLFQDVHDTIPISYSHYVTCCQNRLEKYSVKR